MDAAELIKALARLGYRSDDPVHAITIPNHRPLRVGTLAAIITDVAAQHKMERDMLVKLLLS
jgi:predicted RNA binding protein YcfA (HicA-like mRNA interferase family)